MNMEYIIRSEGVWRGFPVGGDTFWALKDINVTIPKGKLTLLKGRSGSGKTTLLNILSALDPPSKGTVWIGDTNVTELSDSGRDKLRRKKVGYVYQSVALIPMMTAYENVEFALRLARYEGDWKKRAEECRRLSAEADQNYKETMYSSAVQKMASKDNMVELESAQKMFREISGYLDSAKREEECAKALEHLELKAAKRRRIITIAAGILIIGVLIFFNSPVWRNIRAGILGEEILTEEESRDMALKNAEPGQVVSFGPFTWYVLQTDEEKITLLLEHAEKQADLRGRPYNEEMQEVTWETSSLRDWLNTSFITDHFSEEEQAKILTETTVTPDNGSYGTDGGADTQDKVRILYPSEVEAYPDILAKIKMNIWLLCPGNEPDTAMFMSARHTLMDYGYAVNCTDFYVCPVFTLKLTEE